MAWASWWHFGTAVVGVAIAVVLVARHRRTHAIEVGTASEGWLAERRGEPSDF